MRILKNIAITFIASTFIFTSCQKETLQEMETPEAKALSDFDYFQEHPLPDVAMSRGENDCKQADYSISQSATSLVVIWNDLSFTANSITYGLDLGNPSYPQQTKSIEPGRNWILLTSLEKSRYYRYRLDGTCNGSPISLSFGFVTVDHGAAVCSPPTYVVPGYYLSAETTKAHVFWQNVKDVPIGSFGNNREAYHIRYRKARTSAWRTLKSAFPNKPLSNLSPDTDYEYQVSAQCPDGSHTQFSRSFYFRTKK